MRSNSQFLKLGVPLIVVSGLVGLAIILAVTLSEKPTTKGELTPSGRGWGDYFPEFAGWGYFTKTAKPLLSCPRPKLSSLNNFKCFPDIHKFSKARTAQQRNWCIYLPLTTPSPRLTTPRLLIHPRYISCRMLRCFLRDVTTCSSARDVCESSLSQGSVYEGLS